MLPQRPLASNRFLDQIEIQQNYSRLQNELQSLAGKIGELEQEAEEHGLCHFSQSTTTFNLLYLPCFRLVLSTLNEALQVEPDRKCFRLIGGVLVERTVKDVVPALQTNREGVCTSILQHH
jgi:prefoldin subunit 2